MKKITLLLNICIVLVLFSCKKNRGTKFKLKVRKVAVRNETNPRSELITCSASKEFLAKKQHG
jgi:hypothetical protein